MRLIAVVALGLLWLTPAAPPAYAAAAVNQASITFTPATGSAGDPVRLTGGDWIFDGGDVSLYVSRTGGFEESQRIVSTAPTETGLIDTEFVVPDRDPGTYTFHACQRCGDIDGTWAEAESDFLVTAAPTMTFPPPSVRLVGQEITVTGTGWVTDAGPVQVFAQEGDRTQPELALTEATVTVNRSFATPLTVPDLPPGMTEFYACQRCDDAVPVAQTTAFLEIAAPRAERAPTLVILPGAGPPGAEFTISGTDWSDTAGPVLLFTDPDQIGSDANVFARLPVSGGEFSEDLLVPGDLAAGDYTWAACQNCGLRSPSIQRVAFTVLPIPTVSPPGLSLSPPRAAPGAPITVIGTRWLPERGAVSVFADIAQAADPGTALLTAEPSADGTFSGTLTVPADAAADLDLYACQDCTALAGFPVATAELALVAAAPRGVSEPESRWPQLLTVALIVLVLLVTAALLQQQVTRRVRRASGPPRPTLRAHADTSFRVIQSDSRHETLPTLRLVPHRDETAHHESEHSQSGHSERRS